MDKMEMEDTERFKKGESGRSSIKQARAELYQTYLK
jgi:hypothetical protein